MEDRDPWRRATEKHFGSSFSKKWAQLKVDVWSITHGLKPSILVDYLPQDARRLQHLLQDAADVTENVCVVDVDQSLLLSTPSNLQLLAASSSVTSTSAVGENPAYVDVTRGLLRPRVASADISGVARDQLADWCRLVSHGLEHVSGAAGVRHHVPVVEAPLPASQAHLNLCTLYGQLVGYPVIYWFDTEQGYSLDMVDLVQHSLTMQHRPGEHGSKEWLPAASQKHTLYSFTVPECVLPQVQQVVDLWSEGVKRRVAAVGLHVELTYKRICLPAIAL